VIRALRRHLSYANVIATAAMFIALGGSSYAALKITGADIKDRSLSYRELKRNTLGGSRIKESRLGMVPWAKNADRLNGVTAARLLLRCPEETVPVYAICAETSARGPLPYTSAAVTCEGVERSKTPGRRLPSHDELLTAIGEPGVNLAPGGELTRNVYPTAAGRVEVLYVTDDVGSVAITSNTAAGAKAFRCVTDPLN
jgi:hypothetical protein